MARRYGRVKEQILFERILEETKEYPKVRIMGIESGGVYLAEDALLYLIGNGLKNIGVFSVNVSRKEGRIKEKDKLEREIEEEYGPDFLYKAFLLPIDDDVREGTTRDIVIREIEDYFIPVHEIIGYKCAAVATKKDEKGKPLVPIYGGYIEEAPPVEIPEHVGGKEIIDTSRLHIKPFVYESKSVLNSIYSEGCETLKSFTRKIRGRKSLSPKILSRINDLKRITSG